MKKKGEITSSQIITLVITILSFIVLLIVTMSIYYNDDNLAPRELCHQSVLLRASSPLDAAGALVPLNCVTEKICIAESGDKTTCSEFLGEDENTRTSVELSGTDEQKKKQIEKVIADEMLECWQMMGEGKLDLFDASGKGPVYSAIGLDAFRVEQSTCLVCSRIAIENKEETLKLFRETDTNSYLENTQAPNSQYSYLQTFTDRQVQGFPAEFKEELETKEGEETETKEVAILFMQILTDETPLEAGIRSGTFVLGASTAIGAVKLTPKAWIVKAMAGIGAGGIAYYQTSKSRAVSAVHCKEFAGENAKSGCSIITVMDYNNAEALNEVCGRIEGRP